MAKYEPSGRVGGAGLLLVLGMGLLAAVLSGVVFHFIGRFFYLIILFPVIWGFVIGAATTAGVRHGKCRSAALAAAAGLVASVASYGVFQLLDNVHHRSLLREAVKLEKGEDFDQAYNEFLQKPFGKTGFMGELAWRAKLGMNISRSGSSGRKDKEPMISGTGMYVYWLIELAIIAGIGLCLPAAVAAAPFCEPCEEWYGKTETAGIAGAKLDEARRALEARNYAALTPCVSPGLGEGVMTMEQCPKGCESAVVLKLESVSRDKKGKESRKTVFEDMVPQRDAGAIRSAWAGPPPPSGPTGADPAAP